MVQPQLDTAASKATEIASAVAVAWAVKGAESDLAQTNKDGLSLRLKATPGPVLNKLGDVVGVDAWVQLFDPKGNEIPIDPHRRIVNPPLLIRDGGVDEKGKATYSRDPAGAYWQVLWDSVLGNPNPAGWGTRGTVTTVYADASNFDLINSSNATYATARGGSNLKTGTTVFGIPLIQFGQWNGTLFDGRTFDLELSYLAFDTSAIADSDTVTAVALGLCAAGALQADVAWTMQAREFDFDVSVAAADFRTGTQFNGDTLLATKTSASWNDTDGTYNTFTENGTNFQNATNIKTGVVHVVLGSSLYAAGTAPGGGVSAGVGTYDPSTVGSTKDPKLDITSSAAGGAGPMFTQVMDIRPAKPPRTRNDDVLSGSAMVLASPSIPGNFPPYNDRLARPLRQLIDPGDMGTPATLIPPQVIPLPAGLQDTKPGARPFIAAKSETWYGMPDPLLTAPSVPSPYPPAITVLSRPPQQRVDSPTVNLLAGLLSAVTAPAGVQEYNRPPRPAPPRYATQLGTPYSLLAYLPEGAYVYERLAKALRARPTETPQGTPFLLLANTPEGRQIAQGAIVMRRQGASWVGTRANLMTAPAVVPAGVQFWQRSAPRLRAGQVAIVPLTLSPGIIIAVVIGTGHGRPIQIGRASIEKLARVLDQLPRSPSIERLQHTLEQLPRSSGIERF